MHENLSGALNAAVLAPEEDQSSKSVGVTIGLVSLFTDNKLGCALCHELAHIREDHIPADEADTKTSYKQEFEADERAIDIAIESGFDPRGLVTGLGKMAGTTGSLGILFLGGEKHPSFADRIVRLGTILAKKGYK